jgi:hypothetical protein
MPENEVFHDKVISGLAVLTTQSAGIIQRLDHINGSVRHLYNRVEQSEKDLLSHQNGCSVKEEMREIERKILAGDYPPPNEVKRDILEIERQLSKGDYPGSIEVKKELEQFRIAEAERCATERLTQTWMKRLWPWIERLITAGAILALLNGREIVNGVFHAGAR